MLQLRSADVRPGELELAARPQGAAPDALDHGDLRADQRRGPDLMRSE